MDTNKKEDKKNGKNADTNVTKKDEVENNNENNQANQTIRSTIYLPKLASQSEIQNSDIILSIFEICTFNKNIIMNVDIIQRHFGKE